MKTKQDKKTVQTKPQKHHKHRTKKLKTAQNQNKTKRSKHKNMTSHHITSQNKSEGTILKVEQKVRRNSQWYRTIYRLGYLISK